MIISKTPMRISFVGGGSDLEAYYKHRPGAVVSTAINKHVYVIVNKRFDDLIRIVHSETEMVSRVSDIKHNIIREALKLSGIKSGIEILYVGDIVLAGTGLGSSSSLAVGILNALSAYKGETVSAEDLARGACRLEIEILGHPIGKQDQYAAAYGGFNYIQFNPDESVLVEPIALGDDTKEALSRRLLMFYTGKAISSDKTLTEQKEKTKDNLHVFDEMVKLTVDAKNSLAEGSIDKIGGLLHENWLHKKKLASNITNSNIDKFYEKAMNAGACGGKILGSGGGGFLLFYCEEEKQDNIRKALSDLREVSFGFEPEGSKIIYS